MVCHFFVQYIAKTGTYFRYHNIALALQKGGNIVKIFGADYSKNAKSRIELQDGIEYHITACYFPGQKFFGQLNNPLSAIKRAFKKYPNCDIAHLFQPCLSAFIPWYWHRKKAKKIVYDWDDLWTDGLISKGSNFLHKWEYFIISNIEKKAPALANATTVCSDYLLKAAIKNGSKKTIKFYNGFWNETSSPSKLECRKKFNLQQDAFYIGFVGRSVNEIDWCYQLLAAAKTHNPKIRLAMCGMPDFVTNNLPEHLKAMVDYKGYLTPNEAHLFMKALDIGLLPLESTEFNKSRFPIKFADYLAAETPILCSQIGECALIATNFAFVKTVAANVNSWVDGGLQMINALQQQQWPAINTLQINEYLNWENIYSKLEVEYKKI